MIFVYGSSRNFQGISAEKHAVQVLYTAEIYPRIPQSIFCDFFSRFPLGIYVLISNEFEHFPRKLLIEIPTEILIEIS